MVRRQLGRKLRALRESCGKTREDVVMTRLMSLGKLKSIEYGRSMVRPGDVYELGCLYGASPEVIEGLRRLAVATTQEVWWEDYGEGLVKGFETYLDLESYASELWIYEPAMVNGLVQTEDYALAVDHATARPGTDEAVTRNSVEVRLTRQRTLREREPRPTVHLVLGEAALRLQVGGPEVMAGQRARLLQAADDEGLDLRILTDAAGPHRGLFGGFAVLDFDDPEDPSVAYVESCVGFRYHDRDVHLERFRGVFQEIYGKAIPVEEYLE
jgi:hypothetical protein